jgi:chemotaxis protein CheX
MTTPKTRPTLLVVDDEPDIREALKSYIENTLETPLVLQAANGVEGLKIASNQRFDLIITDLKMPRMDGKTFLNQLNELPPGFRPKGCFVVSGNLEEKTTIKVVGNTVFFPKPIPVEKFKEHLKKFFGLTSSEAQAARPKMDINFINPFVEATLEVLQTTAAITAKKEQVFLRTPDQSSGDVSALVALNSQSYLGSFSVSFEEACFLAVVNSMLGESYQKITPEIQDAASELCSQIFGIAKKVLNEKGHTIQPAIPSVISGKNHQIKHPVEGTCIAVKFSTPVGIFQVEAVLTEK